MTLSSLVSMMWSFYIPVWLIAPNISETSLIIPSLFLSQTKNPIYSAKNWYTHAAYFLKPDWSKSTETSLILRFVKQKLDLF